MLILDDITVRIAGRLLIDHANITLPDGSKTGLVGHNGSGKSTLFRIITGDLAAETGTVIFPKNLRIGQVAQEAPATRQSLIEIVLEADRERHQLLQEAEKATDAMRIAEIHTRLADIDAHSAEARAGNILFGLGFDSEAQKRPANSFSGGWRMRVALAAVLFAQPDLLLLDEPTNYLDLEGTLWLIDYVRRYPNTVIIISHDRDLLNSATNSIMHLENKQLSFWRGNYDQFEKLRALATEHQQKQAAKQDAYRKHMEAFVARFRASATKARQAQSRLKALQRLSPISVWQDERVKPIQFPTADKAAASPILVLNNVSVGYENDKPILKNLNLRIDNDDRIALLGSNGNGKSTFAKLLAGRLKEQNGSIIRSPNLKIAFFAQHQLDDLVPEDTPIEHVRKLMPNEPEPKVRSRVSQMGLSTEKMMTKAKELSGGEKARLLMGLATFHGPNLIILDEPTNHLDIDSREELVRALNDFNGAVILIAHDRHLIDATMDRLWLVKDQNVQPYNGDLDDYRADIFGIRKPKEIIQETKPVEVKSKNNQRKMSAEKRERLAPLKKQITMVEELIARLQNLLEKFDKQLADSQLYTQRPEKAGELAKERADAAKRLQEAENRWLQLTEDYENKAN